MIRIRHRYTKEIIYESEKRTIKEAVVEAISKGINLENAGLENAGLEYAYLENAYLNGANLNGANLENAYLNGANLNGANLENAYLKGANLENAKNICSFQCGEHNRVIYAVKHNNKIMFKIGCFWGDSDEAVIQVKNKYGESSYYERLINIYTEMLMEV